MTELTIVLIVYSILITVAMILMIIIRNRKNEKIYFEYQDKITQTQLEEMNHIYTTMRGWRHDYHNHMQKIRAHLALGEVKQADNYIDLMEKDLKGIDFKYKSGNTGVDAILNSKLSLAEQSGLHIKCDVSLPEKLSISQLDLCVLIGNLIDNAIESCEKIEDENSRFIRIYMAMQKKQLYISVSNATNETVRKIDKEYITNKRGNHGHGLKRIDLIVEKQGGFINRQNEPGVWATEVLLPTD